MSDIPLHDNETETTPDILEVMESGRERAKEIYAGLSGSMQRWEMQMLVSDKKAEELEAELGMLTRHVVSENGSSGDSDTHVEKGNPMIDMHADSFTTDEHRSFLSRVLGPKRKEL